MKHTLLLLLAVSLLCCASSCGQQQNNYKEADRVEDIIQACRYDTITLNTQSQQALNSLLDSMLVMVHSNSSDVRLNANQLVMDLMPTMFLNQNNPDIDSLLQRKMLDKYFRINVEWYIEEIDDGCYYLSKEIITADNFFSIDVLLDGKTKKCIKMQVGFPTNATELAYLSFFKNIAADDDGKFVAIESTFLIPETQTMVGIPEPETFNDFLTNERLFVGYLNGNEDLTMEERDRSVTLNLKRLHEQYEELLKRD